MKLQIQERYHKGKSYVLVGTGGRLGKFTYQKKIEVNGQHGIFMTQSQDPRHPAKWDRLRRIAQ
jgi:hypothetical protein